MIPDMKLYRILQFLRKFLCIACTSGGILTVSASGEEVLRVLVPIEPYRFVVEFIAGEAVAVESLVPAGMDPHHFSPTGKQVRFMASADLYFATGLPFEQQNGNKHLANSKARRIDLLEGLPLKESTYVCEHGHVHSHSHAGHDAHGHDPAAEAMDPHVWTSPLLMSLQVDRILETLVAQRPGSEALFRERAMELKAELHALDAQFHALREQTGPLRLLVYHPAWSYFCEAYGWQQVSVEREGKALQARELVQLLQSIDEGYFPILLIQPQIQARMPQQFASEAGLAVEIVDPLAYAYLDAMRHLREVLASAAGD